MALSLQLVLAGGMGDFRYVELPLHACGAVLRACGLQRSTGGSTSSPALHRRFEDKYGVKASELVARDEYKHFFLPSKAGTFSGAADMEWMAQTFHLVEDDLRRRQIQELRVVCRWYALLSPCYCFCPCFYATATVDTADADADVTCSAGAEQQTCWIDAISLLSTAAALATPRYGLLQGLPYVTHM